MARVASLNEQLAGETEGFVPGGSRPPAPPGGLKANAAYGNLVATAIIVMRGADGNCDSKLTRGEVGAAVRWFFAVADGGKQGWVDRAKVTQALVGRLQQVVGQRRGDRGDRRVGNRPADVAGMWGGVVMGVADTEKTGKVTLSPVAGGGGAGV